MDFTRKDSKYYTTFAGVVNKHCDEFKISKLSANNFKCLMFVLGLEPSKDAEIRRRVLNKFEHESNLMLQQIAQNSQHFVCVQDLKDIEESGEFHIKNMQTFFLALQWGLLCHNRLQVRKSTTTTENRIFYKKVRFEGEKKSRVILQTRW